MFQYISGDQFNFENRFHQLTISEGIFNSFMEERQYYTGNYDIPLYEINQWNMEEVKKRYILGLTGTYPTGVYIPFVPYPASGYTNAELIALGGLAEHWDASLFTTVRLSNNSPAPANSGAYYWNAATGFSAGANAVQTSAPTQPIYKSGNFNGRNSLQFGPSYGMGVSNSAKFLNQSIIHVFAAIKSDNVSLSGGNHQPVFSTAAGGTTLSKCGLVARHFTSGNVFAAIGDPIAANVGQQGISCTGSFDGPVVLAGIYNYTGGFVQLRVNGSGCPIGTFAPALYSNTGNNLPYIGQGWSNQARYSGCIGELLIFTGKHLTEDEIVNIEGRLISRWLGR